MSAVVHLVHVRFPFVTCVKDILWHKKTQKNSNRVIEFVSSILVVTLFGNDCFFSNVIRPNLRVVLKICKVIYLDELLQVLN